MMTKGVCVNAACANGASGTPIDRYAGPGEYCPECGDLLENAPVTTNGAADAGHAFGGLTPLQALQQFDVAPAAAAAPRARPRMKRFAVAGAAVCVAAVSAVIFLRPLAMGHQASGDGIRVCRSSMTERFASDAIAAYASTSGTPASRFTFAPSAPCNVTFAVTDDAAASGVVGHDAIVAVVNPQNALIRLSQTQLRRIYSGEITDWEQVGGAPGPIVAMMPEVATDESQAAAKTLLGGARPAPSVLRLATSAEVVRAIVSGTGRNAIGLVAFSSAVPSKVLQIAAAPAPSALSIGAHSYPLTVGITVGISAGTSAPAASALVHYARSEFAQELVSRDGLVPKKGF